jgi:hypothetical protein
MRLCGVQCRHEVGELLLVERGDCLPAALLLLAAATRVLLHVRLAWVVTEHLVDQPEKRTTTFSFPDRDARGDN